MGVITDVAEDHPMHAWIAAERAAANEIAVPKFFAHNETTRRAVGLDLAQSSDFTAISVVEHVRGIIDGGTEFERSHGLSAAKQKPAEQYRVRHLQRIRGWPYPDVVEHVRELMDRDELRKARLVIDATGCGGPVCDLFDARGVAHTRVTITGGSVTEVTPVGLDKFHVSKQRLVSGIDAALAAGTLKFAAALSEAGQLRSELADFRRSLSATGRSSYEAASGRHDDLLVSISLGIWWLSRKGPAQISMGRY